MLIIIYIYFFFRCRRLAGNNGSVDGGELLCADGAATIGSDRFDFARTVVAAVAISLFQRLQTERSVPATVQRSIPATVQRSVPATVQRRVPATVQRSAVPATVRSAVLQQRAKPSVQRTVRADLTAVVRHLPGGQLHFQVSRRDGFTAFST